ncbi:LCP family protein [Nocardioides acrostichi]|uniref:LCP family protein n=1 Tax=Nocardioides acrostichi TaxID=2784339 RepID=A0A930UVF2_9ACTN|nr:LCP family protein [Nocardioides acrostichi]MBF4160901.1 LCP family protein [Nocardioides acrostichi]
MRRSVRTVVLGVVLALIALVVPTSQVHPEQATLVAVRQARGLDVDPHVVWILAVGSDARPGQLMTRTRGDALQLVGIDTRTGAAAAIGVPRDSFVDIPGHGYDKINASMVFGGPQLLARTVGNLVGIRPDFVFVTRFPFFEDMIDDIGGITVVNPRPFSDSALKPKGFRAGRISLDGYAAMAFSRIRHDLPRGDFDRSANQQRVLRGIQARVAQRAAEPGFIDRGVFSVLQHTSTALGPAALFRLARAVAAVDPAKITTCVVTGSIGTAGAASIVRPNVAQARRLGHAARSDATLPRGC